MYNIDELNVKNRDELCAIAKEMEIVGRGKMNKAELVQATYDNQPFEEESPVVADAVDEEIEVVVEEAVVEQPVEQPAEEKNKKPVDKPKKLTQEDFDKFRADNHQKIVESCEVGQFVAFKRDKNDNKAISAKIMRKSTKRQKLEVQTSYGRKFIIDFDMVIWVKKDENSKWPHGVYKLLKGIE